MTSIDKILLRKKKTIDNSSSTDKYQMLLTWLKEICDCPLLVQPIIPPQKESCLPNNFKIYKTSYENDMVHPFLTYYYIMTEAELMEYFDNPFNKCSYLSIKHELYRINLDIYLKVLGYDVEFIRLVNYVQSSLSKYVSECNDMIYQLIGPSTYQKIIQFLRYDSSLQFSNIHKYLFTKYLQFPGRNYNFAESSNHRMFENPNGQIFHIFFTSSLYK
jgi:hypothetical protein